MLERLTEAEEEELLYRFEKLLGRMSSEAALNAAVAAEVAKRKIPALHASNP